jgi:hypothetical protein
VVEKVGTDSGTAKSNAKWECTITSVFPPYSLKILAASLSMNMKLTVEQLKILWIAVLVCFSSAGRLVASIMSLMMAAESLKVKFLENFLSR